MKKFLISLFAALILLFLKPVPAKAYTSITGGTLTFKHYLIINTTAPVPTVTFRGQIAPGEAEGKVEPGPIGSYINSVSYNENTPEYYTVQPGDDVILDAGQKYVKGIFTVDLSVAVFNKPGIFRYEVTATKEGCTGGMTECQKLYLDIYVIDDGTGNLTVSSRFLHQKDKSDKANSITDSFTCHDVRVINHVTGNQGDHNKDFEFKFKINGENTDRKFSLKLKDGTTRLIKSGDINAITLKHGEEFCFCGLTEHEKFIITESNYSVEGYDTKYSIDGNPEIEAYSTGDIEIGSLDRKVVFTNHKNSDEPVTGFISDNYIYIMMIIFAMSLGVIFIFNKDKKQRS